MTDTPTVRCATDDGEAKAAWSNLQLDGHKLAYHPSELRKWKDGETHFPIFVEMSPVTGCNHRCRACYVEYILDDKSNYKILQRDRLLELVREFGRIGVRALLYQGTGEPLMNKALPEAVALGKEHGVNSAIATNGVLLTPEKSDVCAPGLSWLRFSMMEANEELYNYTHRGKPNDFGAVIKNIEYITNLKRKHNLEIVISTMILAQDYNTDSMLETVKLSKSLGVDYIAIKPMSQNIWNNFNFERDIDKKNSSLFQEIEAETTNECLVKVRYDLFESEAAVDETAGKVKLDEWVGKDVSTAPDPAIINRSYNACYGLDFMTLIEADGSIYPCSHLWRQPDYCLGNLYENTFEEIWTSDRKKQIFHGLFTDFDLRQCKARCRQHPINGFLWDIKHNGADMPEEKPGPDPMHVNFI